MTISRTEQVGESPRGFTLLELMVVVVIISVLAGLLLPAMAKAKGRARRVVCAGSERQLLLAWNLYSVDHLDRLAPNGPGGSSVPGSARTWVGGGDHFFLPGYTNCEYLVDERYAAFGAYLRSAGTYKCPEDRTMFKRWGAPSVPQIRSYAMNAYMGWIANHGELSPGYKIYGSLSDLGTDSPSELSVFQEVHPNSICMPAFITYMPGGEVDGFYHYPSSLHQAGSLTGFADGHIDRHSWTDARTRLPLNSGILAHWDRSPGNSDIQWLREHTTRSLGAGSSILANAETNSRAASVTSH
jgi:prepilin-type N-terminal cleavage/methylation domain-containing protein